MHDGSYVLGAPGVVLQHSINNQSYGLLRKIIETHTRIGRRVLCLAHTDDDSLGSPGTQPVDKPVSMATTGLPPGLPTGLPPGLVCVALIVLSDVIRPEATATFRFFADEGVAIKVISGDDPLTVSNIAAQAGIEDASQYIDMGALDKQAGDYTTLVASYTVFGRASPGQKKELVAALRRSGRTVCMTGDGVNDVLAMKEADCSVAMRSGSGAARGVSDFVLMESDFSAMIKILNEGRRVINNIETVSALYLIKTIYSTILSLVYIFVPAPYPFIPLQLTPINVFTVGIPSFFITLRKNFSKPEGRFGSNILKYSLPAALTIVVNIILIHLIGRLVELLPEEVNTIRVIMTGTAGFYALFLLARPQGKEFMLFASLIIVFSACLFVFMPYLWIDALELRDAVLLIPLMFCIPIIFTLIGYIADKFADLTKHKR